LDKGVPTYCAVDFRTIAVDPGYPGHFARLGGAVDIELPADDQAKPPVVRLGVANRGELAAKLDLSLDDRCLGNASVRCWAVCSGGATSFFSANALASSRYSRMPTPYR
jgi:hypothetical protein